MGMWSRLAQVLGFSEPLVPADPPPLRVGEAGRARMASLAPGVRVMVATLPVEGGRAAAVRELPSSEPVDPASGVVISTADAAAMAGLVLDWDGARWVTRLELRIEPLTTPNPDGRLYETERPLARGRPRFFEKSHREAAPGLVQRLLGIPEVQTVLVREHTVTIERTPGVGWAWIDRAVQSAIRDHFWLLGEPIPDDTSPARLGLIGRVEAVLRDRVAPAIHADGGDIELVDVTDGVARVHLVGACRTCPASEATVKMGVERALRSAFPGEIVRVESV